MLKRFYTAVVHRRRAVLAAFVLAAVLSVFASRAVQVDYDINDYLPPDSPSTLALEQMNSAFTGGIPNMRVMVRDVTVPEALDYKEKLAAIDGVEAVTWLDDSLDVTVPLQMQDTATVETYYKDNCALFTVTVEDANRLEAVAAIQDLIGEDNALAGTAVSTAVATNSTVTEVAKIAAIGDCQSQTLNFTVSILDTSSARTQISSFRVIPVRITSVSPLHSSNAFRSSSVIISFSTSPSTSSRISRSHSPVVSTFLAKPIPLRMFWISSCFFSSGNSTKLPSDFSKRNSLISGSILRKKSESPSPFPFRN